MVEMKESSEREVSEGEERVSAWENAESESGLVGAEDQTIGRRWG
jgi:hypothetical protein